MRIQEFIVFENGCMILKPTAPTTPPPLIKNEMIPVAPPRKSSLTASFKIENGRVVADHGNNEN